jgi:hypothetical protein
MCNENCSQYNYLVFVIFVKNSSVVDHVQSRRLITLRLQLRVHQNYVAPAPAHNTGKYCTKRKSNKIIQFELFFENCSVSMLNITFGAVGAGAALRYGSDSGS